MLDFIINNLFSVKKNKKEKSRRTIVRTNREIKDVVVLERKKTTLSSFFEGQSGLNTKERERFEIMALQNRTNALQSQNFCRV